MRRAIFYIPGFDPRGASHYHRLFSEQAFKQQNLLARGLEFSPRQRISKDLHSWSVKYEIETGAQLTDVFFCAWDDVVRRYWPKSLMKLMLAFIALLPLHYLSGGIFRIKRLGARGPFYTALIPMAIVLLTFTTASFLAWLLSLTMPLWISLPIGLLSFLLMLALADKQQFFWLLRIYYFVALWGWGKTPEMEPKANVFAEKIGESLDNADVNEVVVIGHSIGALLAYDVVSRLSSHSHASKLKVLTLGHSIPLMTEMPDVQWYKDKLDSVGEMPIKVFDVTAAMDGASFYGVSPLYTSSHDTAELYSARFHKLFSAESYKKLRKDPYRMHFQYLMATEKLGLMDFAWLAYMPGLLEDKFAQYPDSQISRVEVS